MSTSREADDGYISAEDEDFVLDAAQAAADDAIDAAEEGGLVPDTDADDVPPNASFYERRLAKRKKYDRKMKELENHALAAIRSTDNLWRDLQAVGQKQLESTPTELPWLSGTQQKAKVLYTSPEKLISSCFCGGPSAARPKRRREAAQVCHAEFAVNKPTSQTLRRFSMSGANQCTKAGAYPNQRSLKNVCSLLSTLFIV